MIYPKGVRSAAAEMQAAGMANAAIAAAINVSFGTTLDTRAVRRMVQRIKVEKPRQTELSPEALKEVQKLYKKGTSTTRIAEIIDAKYGTTHSKSKMAGVISRTGVRETDGGKRRRVVDYKKRPKKAAAPRTRTQNVRAGDAPAARPVVRSKMPVPPTHLRDPFHVPAAPVSFREVRNDQCRRVSSAPNGLQTMLCGAKALPGRSWCQDCFRIVYVSPADRIAA